MDYHVSMAMTISVRQLLDQITALAISQTKRANAIILSNKQEVSLLILHNVDENVYI